MALASVTARRLLAAGLFVLAAVAAAAGQSSSPAAKPSRSATLAAAAAPSGGAARIGYAYLHTTDADWTYAGMQLGTASGILPTNERPFNHDVNVVSGRTC